MAKFTKVHFITECYHSCPFFNNVGQEMQCDHPIFKDRTIHKSVYDNLIISQDNSRGRVPDKCPLRNDETTEIIMRVRLSL